MSNDPRRADYETTPLTRQEYISAIVHLYRGELSRATAWRVRLDTSTNWAVLTTAGLLTFSFNDQGPHWALLVGLLLITLLMGYEARRFRIFDLWRSRVRKIEENFYGPILLRNPVSPQESWGDLLAQDLLRPKFKVTYLGALRARFVRNYWAIYMVLVLSWVLKVVMISEDPHGAEEIRTALAMGMLPWWAPLVYLFGFLSLLFGLVVLVPKARTVEDEAWYQDMGRRRGDHDVSTMDL